MTHRQNIALLICLAALAAVGFGFLSYVRHIELSQTEATLLSADRLLKETTAEAEKQDNTRPQPNCQRAVEAAQQLIDQGRRTQKQDIQGRTLSIRDSMNARQQGEIAILIIEHNCQNGPNPK